MTQGKAEARANKTFIAQASLTIVNYGRKNIFIVQATDWKWDKLGTDTKFFSLFHSIYHTIHRHLKENRMPMTPNKTRSQLLHQILSYHPQTYQRKKSANSTKQDTQSAATPNCIIPSTDILKEKVCQWHQTSQRIHQILSYHLQTSQRKKSANDTKQDTQSADVPNFIIPSTDISKKQNANDTKHDTWSADTPNLIIPSTDISKEKECQWL
jgi:hypothetical protein